MSVSAANDKSVEPLPRIAIADALRNDWFEIWYQPKVDLKRKCLAGAESLARIRHPQLGVLQPGSFVPEADSQCIAALAEYALVAALYDWRMFDEAGFNLQLAVNLPLSALVKVPIAQLVSEYMPKCIRWPGLILEVSGAEMVRHIDRVGQIVSRVQVSDIKIAMDDFGADCSSFSSLSDVPMAEVKIAGHFVKGCATDAANAATCRNAIDLAHRAGSAVVADGVESALDMQAVMAMGCDAAQGPLIAPFLPKQDLLNLLRKRNAPRPSRPRDMVKTPVQSISVA